MARMSSMLMLTLASLSSLLFAVPVYAAHEPGHSGCTSPTFFGIPSWDQYVDKDPARACALNLVFPDGIWLIVLGILDILFRLATYVAVGYIIWGGWKLITSSGNPDGIKAGRETILNAVIGLVLTIAASIIVRFVAGVF